MDLIFYLIKFFQLIVFVCEIVSAIIKSSLIIIQSILYKCFSDINKSYLNFKSFKSVVMDRKIQKSIKFLNILLSHFLIFYIKFKENGLSSQSKLILLEWVKNNSTNRYPSNQEKEYLSLKSGLSIEQVSHWFYNYKKRKINSNDLFLSTSFKKILNESFEVSQYPSKEDILLLKLKTGYSEKKISLWFAKRRYLDSH